VSWIVVTFVIFESGKILLPHLPLCGEGIWFQRVYFIGVTLDKDSGLAGIKLSELSAHIGKKRLLIAALIRGEKLIIPSGDDSMMLDDLVY
jgi:Trk K+ transport system NAD-binding subunit